MARLVGRDVIPRPAGFSARAVVFAVLRIELATRIQKGKSQRRPSDAFAVYGTFFR